jgi:hypothetical protein
MIWRMANPFDTDYSFLNLPEKGSDVRGPIDLPSVEPVNSNFQIEGYAPRQLQRQKLVQPSLLPFLEEENEELLSSARPFEDIQSLGATFGQRLAETERFFGERVSSLQGNIDDLINTKSDLTKQLEAAFLQQDEMSQQAIEEQIAALDAQRAELVAQLEQSVAEAEANGVDAVAAAEQVAAEKIATLDQQIAQTAQELQEALAQQDVIRAEESEKRLLELENQKVTLTDQFTQQQTALQEQFGQREAELTGTIDTLQGEINNITGARDSAIAERDQAIAQQDTIRAEAADQQAQALDAQAGDYQAQLDQITGQVGERDQTIADLQAQLEGLQQAPAGTPQIPDASSIPGFQEQFPYLDLLSKEQPQEVKDMVAKSLATGEPVISPDQVQDMINRMGGQAGPVEAPQMPPKRGDQIFIDDRPRFISEERMPSNVAPAIDLRLRPGIPDNLQIPATPIPQAPAITPPRRPMSVGGIGGMGGRINRMMVR